MDHKKFKTIIIGSGAAGLNCALQLINKGIDPNEIAIITDNLGGGTSYNAGSDKQTYYRLSLVNSELESPTSMAQSLFSGGSMHGDIALIEAACSIQAFMNLVNIGVPFPHNKYGEFVGYKTDNDDKSRGTSIGPLTSRVMCEQLLTQLKKHKITIFDKHLVIDILKHNDIAVGILAIDINKMNTLKLTDRAFLDDIIIPICAEFIILATGGPAGMYSNSVYPKSQWGATSLAINAGVTLQNLTESQYGLASTKFRWNVSGSYQQVIPRYVSFKEKDKNGGPIGEPVEFLNEYFPDFTSLSKATFLKGYQWPFNPERIVNYGSSLIDLAVHIEQFEKGRHVYLDFQKNPKGFNWDLLDATAKEYLEKSNAFQEIPNIRLSHLNQKAIEIYKMNGINLWTEPLEISVCAQHCNGGVTGNIWWETNISRLFTIGELNGSHGVHRPGGAALNSGQVAGIRVSEKIVYGKWTSDIRGSEFIAIAEKKKEKWIKLFADLMRNNGKNLADISGLINRLQKKMMKSGSYIRDLNKIEEHLVKLKKIRKKIKETVLIENNRDIVNVWRLLDLIICQSTFLTYMKHYLIKNGGSRGSYIVVSNREENAIIPHPLLKNYKVKPQNHKLDEELLEIKLKKAEFDVTDIDLELDYSTKWVKRRPIPKTKDWFETIWQKFDDREIFLS
ncbi:MAG: FAD-binding protein [Candidatus Lokiarchaeota archaeon]|nr:FAD-binding protein [Candidatus Lokiarchaeota archaeon]